MFTAVRYASHNKYGSELIAKTLKLYHLLKSNSVPVELNYDFLCKIIDCSFDPVVLIASGLHVSWLQAESSDETTNSQIEWLQSIIEESDMENLELISQQSNFELPYPRIIPPENLTVLSKEEYNKTLEKYQL